MTADMVIKFFTEYGWQMTVLATSGIFFIGFLKSLGIFEKLGKIKKYVYFALSCAVSIIACTIYLFVTDKFVWKDWAVTIACIIPYTLAIYGIYENTGMRGLLEKCIFKPAKKLIEKLICAFMSRGATSDTIGALLSAFGQDVLREALSQTDNNAAGAPHGNTENAIPNTTRSAKTAQADLITQCGSEEDTDNDLSEVGTVMSEGKPSPNFQPHSLSVGERIKAVFPELNKEESSEKSTSAM